MNRYYRPRLSNPVIDKTTVILVGTGVLLLAAVFLFASMEKAREKAEDPRYRTVGEFVAAFNEHTADAGISLVEPTAESEIRDSDLVLCLPDGSMGRVMAFTSRRPSISFIYQIYIEYEAQPDTNYMDAVMDGLIYVFEPGLYEGKDLYYWDFAEDCSVFYTADSIIENARACGASDEYYKYMDQISAGGNATRLTLESKRSASSTIKTITMLLSLR